MDEPDTLADGTVRLPAPEVRVRAAQDHEVPEAAAPLIAAARAGGWHVGVFYARGTGLATGGTAGRVVDSVSMSAHRPADRRYIIANWIDGTFELAYTAAEPALDIRALTGAELADLVHSAPTGGSGDADQRTSTTQRGADR